TEKEVHERQDYRFRWWQGLLVGAGVGLVSGMSGLAGGVVLVPALALILGVPTGWLAGTSSAVIVFSALAAALGYLTSAPAAALGPGFHGFTCLPVAGLLAITAIPGAQFGAWANRRTGSVLFRRIFAILMLIVVVRLVTSR
ncbi:MAG: sulfite exporter TauE/SafE family protein, partial [Candidatus Krumholzibacteriota bacterium]